MTDQDLLQKNALCDRLMKEGIEGRQEEDAFTRTDSLAELAVELGREDCLAVALAWFDILEQRGISDKLAILLDASRANAIAGNRYGTTWQWEQTTLAREIFYLRRAILHPKFNRVSDTVRCMILNNLGNRRLWRSGDSRPIRSEFEQTGNWPFCALYWLAKDFFERDNDEVAEPEARGLSDIRNYLEHKYLRITVDKPEASPPDDLALMVSRQQFEAKALHLLGLARSALIYLSLGVGFEERRHQSHRAGVPLEELPFTPDLPDAEKI